MKAETPRPSKGCARGAALCAHELKAPTVRPHTTHGTATNIAFHRGAPSLVQQCVATFVAHIPQLHEGHEGCVWHCS